jgi:hypothetical protein
MVHDDQAVGGEGSGRLAMSVCLRRRGRAKRATLAGRLEIERLVHPSHDRPSARGERVRAWLKPAGCRRLIWPYCRRLNWPRLRPA